MVRASSNIGLSVVTASAIAEALKIYREQEDKWGLQIAGTGASQEISFSQYGHQKHPMDPYA